VATGRVRYGTRLSRLDTAVPGTGSVDVGPEERSLEAVGRQPRVRCGDDRRQSSRVATYRAYVDADARA